MAAILRTLFILGSVETLFVLFLSLWLAHKRKPWTGWALSSTGFFLAVSLVVLTVVPSDVAITASQYHRVLWLRGFFAVAGAACMITGGRLSRKQSEASA